MTRYAVNIFTYGPDAGCLGQCIRALQALPQAADMQLFIWDDAGNPCPYPPPGVHYELTAFPRGGNLNGRACVQNMLLLMLRSARMCGAEYVFKIDCDTALLSLRPLLDSITAARHALHGISLNAADPYAAGCLYAFPAAALPGMIAALPAYTSADGNLPEDRTITHLFQQAGGPLCLRPHHTGTDWPAWYFAPVKFTELPDTALLPASPNLPAIFPFFNRYLIYSALNFGNRHELTARTSSPHAAAASCMRHFLDFSLPRTR